MQCLYGTVNNDYISRGVSVLLPQLAGTHACCHHLLSTHCIGLFVTFAAELKQKITAPRASSVTVAPSGERVCGLSVVMTILTLIAVEVSDE